LGPGRAGADGHVTWILSHAMVNQGNVSGALDVIRQALRGAGLSGAERARFHGLAAQCLHVLAPTGPEPAMRAARGARDEGVTSGDPHAMAYGLQAVAGASRWRGRFVQAVALADQAAEAMERAGTLTDSQLDPHLIRANCLFDLDRDAEARQA